MTINEFIEELKKFNGNYQIKICDTDTGWLLDVKAVSDDSTTISRENYNFYNSDIPPETVVITGNYYE